MFQCYCWPFWSNWEISDADRSRTSGGTSAGDGASAANGSTGSAGSVGSVGSTCQLKSRTMWQDMTRHDKLPCKLHLMSTEINWDPQKSQTDIKRLYSLYFSRLSTSCNSLWQVEDVKRHIYVLWFTLCDFSSELDAILCRPWCDPCKVFHAFSRTWEWLGWQGPVIYFPHKLCLQRCTSVIEPC